MLLQLFRFAASAYVPDIARKMTTKQLLGGIYMFRCMDVVQLLAASHQMFEFIKQHSKVFFLCIFFI